MIDNEFHHTFIAQLNVDLSKLTPQKEEVEDETPKETSAPVQEEADPVIAALKEKNIISEPETKEETVSSPAPKNILATPTVRQLARELGIDINFVLGSGENGKITEEDIKRAKENKDKMSPTETTPVVEAPKVQETPTVVEEAKPNFDIKEEIKSTAPITPSVNLEAKSSPQTLTRDMRVPFTSIRSIISKRMTESLTKSAQVTISDEANVTEIVKIRTEQKDRLKEKGIKLSYVAFFIKAYSEACKDFPYFNATVDDTTNEIVLKSEVNCGVAVDTPKGLLVPVIKLADLCSLKELSDEAKRLAYEAIDGKAQGDDLAGSTFSVTNLGALGVETFTPVINIPEVAILGVGGINLKAVGKGGEDVSFIPHIALSLTVNHMAVDGAPGARFLAALVKNIESIDLLLAL